ncbi:MAG: ESPR-type extended signal peptide-containing protein, partial [Megasphaera elsdenii]|nr:ESPR-type extended signal peptide-containing protein [Megasphaera elsdenii]
MNKIYKIVWNKARNCYVVASEFAKNHQTGSSRIKAASVAAVMAATMLTIGTDVIYAAVVKPEDTFGKWPKRTILFDNKKDATTKLNDPNLKHPSVNGHTDECGELTYDTTLTIGDINQVVDKLVDNDKLLYKQGIQKVTMEDGTISLIRNDNSRVTDSIALTGNDGKNGKDTSVTVTVGKESQTFQTGSVVEAKLDDSGKATGLTINGQSYDIKAGKTYKAGDNVKIADDGTISAKDTTYSAGAHVNIDDKNKISVDLSEYAKSDDVAVVYQDNDKNKSLHSTNAGTVGSSSIALGKAATTGEWSVALGDQTKATGEHSTAIGDQAEATKNSSIAIGQQTKAQGENSVAIGQQTKAQGENSVAIGAQIQFTGYSATAVGQQAHATGDYSTALGSMTNVDAVWNGQHPGEWRKSGKQSTAIGYGSGSWGDYSTALGAFAKTENQFNSAIGYNSQATAENAIALGAVAKAEGKFATAIGTSSQATAENTVALGGAAKADVFGGVALGTSSVADRAKGKKGAFAPTQINATDQSTWISTTGAVSVGDTKNNITRQITNVAAGTEATDAVNVAQLKTAKTEVKAGTNITSVDKTTGANGQDIYTINAKDTTYAAGNGIAINGENNAISVKLKEGENNLEVTADGLALNKELTGLTSVTTQNAYVTNVDASKNESVTNVGYVNNQIAGVTLTEGKGISITDKKINVKLKDGEQNLVVNNDGLSMNTTLKGIQSITGAGTGAGSISFEGSNVKVNQNTFNSDGRIQGVVAGKDNTDAVNVGQLKDVVAAGDTDVHIQAGNYTVDKNNKVSMNLVDKAGNDKGTVTITGVAKAEDVAVVYDKNKTSLRSTNAILQTSSKEEKAVDSIALGKDASAVKESVAIGNGASVVEGNNGLGGVALGYKAHAGYKGTSLGSNAISGREGTTLVGANTNSGSLYTTVVGTDSVINSDGTSYKAFGRSINVQGATATVVGSKNTVDNKNGKVYSGVANNVMGSANTIEGSNGVTIQGTGNKVTDAYKDMNIGAFEAYQIGKGDYSALAKKKSGAVAVIGGANTVSKQTDSTVIGYDNKLTGDKEKGSHDVFMAGSHNKLNNVSDSIVMGNENAITDVSNVISFGHQNTISADNAVAIGNGAGVSVEGGVALGVGSVASTDAGAPGYGAAEGETGIAWKATNGAVSVGSSVEGKKITRQITNVAAGTEDTDAVNVAQLKKVSEAAASASQGWKLKTQNGNASDVKPGATVEFDGDANIQVGNDGNKVSVTLKNQLTGIQSITGAGEGAGSISFANDDIKFNNKVTIDNTGKISGVADGKISTDSTDAVNGSQLNAVKETANKGWNLSTGKGKAVNVAPGETVDFSGDDNIVVSNTGKNVVVKLGKELTGLTSVITNNAYVTNVDASNNKSVTNVGYVNNQIAGVTLTEG